MTNSFALGDRPAVSPGDLAVAAGAPAHPGIAYRPEIDGLRAIAVLAVMAYHADLPGAHGGFTGVDIFFVISGYLISAIILQDLRGGRFSFREFYVRRAFRILPAMLLVLLATLLGSTLLVDPAAIKSIGQSAVAAIAMLANGYFWLKSGGYFGLATPNLPLIHYWSLAVEEQFYLIVTPMLVWLWARGTRWTVIAVAVAAACSFVLSCYLGIAKPGANYFLLPSRGWELSAGILVRLGEARLRDRVNGRAADVLASIGLLLLIAPISLLPVGVPFPGVAALPTIVGTCLFLVFGQRARALGPLLASRPLVAIGLISYSSYLWHQPLLAGLRLVWPNALTIATTLAALASSLALGAATWWLVEQPFRRRGEPYRLRLAAIAAATAVVALVGGLFAWKPPVTLTPRQEALVHFADQSIATTLRCSKDQHPQRPLDQSCRIGADVPPTMAIVGDSYAPALMPAFAGPLADAGRNALVLSSSGCAPLLYDPLPAEPRLRPCAILSAQALDYVIAHPQLRSVVLIARWRLYLDAEPFDNGEGGITADDPSRKPHRLEVRRGLERTVARLLAAGRTVILVYPSPAAGWDMPRYLLKRERLGWPTPPLIGNARAPVDAYAREAAEMLGSLGTNPRLKRLDPARGLCGTLMPSRCVIARGGRPLYFDDNHLAPEGAKLALPRAVVAPLLVDR